MLYLIIYNYKEGDGLEKKCECKNSGCGKNRIPERITVSAFGKEITNRDLVCRKCAYKKRGDTKSCLRFDEKPEEVLGGGSCPLFLADGAELSGKSGCGDRGSSCKSCGNCGGCGQ